MQNFSNNDSTLCSGCGGLKMLTAYHYQFVNIFSESHFGGNLLAVFLQADHLTDEQMQLIVCQFNLSEVVFVHSTEEESAVKKLWIFTPEYELPFVGHPTTYTVFVLKAQLHVPNSYVLKTYDDLILIYHQQNQIQFALNTAVKTQHIESNLVLYTVLDSQTTDIVQIVWVNTGSQQLFIQFHSAHAINICQIHLALFHQLLQQSVLYLWFEENHQINVRLFWGLNGVAVKAPCTGLVVANLGRFIQNDLTP